MDHFIEDQLFDLLGRTIFIRFQFVSLIPLYCILHVPLHRCDTVTLG